MTYWNTASFFSLYASHTHWAPETALPAQQRPILDRWVLAEMHALAQTVDDRLENYDTAGAGRALGDFVDDLSNWYVRRSRQRFWEADQNALATLYECLNILTRLLAPFVPFITEEVWQQVIRPDDPAAAESVHLATWPQVDAQLIDPVLSEQVPPPERWPRPGARPARPATCGSDSHSGAR